MNHHKLEFRKLLSILILFLYFLISGCVTQKNNITVSPEFYRVNKDKIAVLPNNLNKNPHGRLMEDEVIKGLINKGYNVISRTDIDRIIEEWEVQSSGITTRKAVEIGKILNVPLVIIIELTDERIYYDRETKSKPIQATIGARLISVETGQVLWVESKSGYSVMRDGFNIYSRLTRQIMWSFPERKI